MFSEPVRDSILVELEKAGHELEASLGRMLELGPPIRRILISGVGSLVSATTGSRGNTEENEQSCLSMENKRMGGGASGTSMVRNVLEGLEGGSWKEERVEEQGVGLDPRFSHSWASAGSTGPGSGWLWILKSRLTLDIYYPARPDEIRRFGLQARKVRVLAPPLRLTHSFAQATAGTAREPPRQVGKRRQEEWMEEDDLLGGISESRTCAVNCKEELVGGLEPMIEVSTKVGGLTLLGVGPLTGLVGVGLLGLVEEIEVIFPRVSNNKVAGGARVRVIGTISRGLEPTLPKPRSSQRSQAQS